MSDVIFAYMLDANASNSQDLKHGTLTSLTESKRREIGDISILYHYPAKTEKRDISKLIKYLGDRQIGNLSMPFDKALRSYLCPARNGLKAFECRVANIYSKMTQKIGSFHSKTAQRMIMVTA